MTRVYLAGPYTRGDVGANVHKAIRVADELFEAGYAPYVPHLTHFWHLQRPHGYEDWLRLDLEWVAACDVLLRLPGKSDGADREAALAKSLGKPVLHSVEAVLRWREAREQEPHCEERVSCPECGAPYQLVRPGKWQETCACWSRCPHHGPGAIQYHAEGEVSGVSGYFCRACEEEK